MVREWQVVHNWLEPKYLLACCGFHVCFDFLSVCCDLPGMQRPLILIEKPFPNTDVCNEIATAESYWRGG